MRISDWSSDVCSSDLQGARSWRASDAARSGASQCPLVAIFAVAPPKYPRPMQRGCDRGKSMSIHTTVLCVTLLTLVGGCARADEAIPQAPVASVQLDAAVRRTGRGRSGVPERSETGREGKEGGREGRT